MLLLFNSSTNGW